MKISTKLSAFGLGISALAFSFMGIASAHVVVKPGDVLNGAFQTFTVSVPVEKDVPTVNIKLEIPQGLQFVTPTVKPGWTIQVEKEGNGQETHVKAITWSGNEIPAGYRDDFSFSAKTPDKPVDLQWKAFQTYSDGSVVDWNLAQDQQPKKADGSPDFSKSGPFSVTKVMAKSAQDTASDHVHQNAHDAQQAARKALYVAAAGVVLSFVAIFFATRQTQKSVKTKK